MLFRLLVKLDLPPCPLDTPVPHAIAHASGYLEPSTELRYTMRICDWWAGGDERSTKLADWAERLGFHVERTIRRHQQRGVECGYIAAAACEKLIPAISEGAWMHIPLDEHCQSLDVIRRGNRFLFNDDTDRPRFLSGSNVSNW